MVSIPPSDHIPHYCTSLIEPPATDRKFTHPLAFYTDIQGLSELTHLCQACQLTLSQLIASLAHNAALAVAVEKEKERIATQPKEGT